MTEQMATSGKYNWKVMIVLSCDHAGLQPRFQALEDDMRQVISMLPEVRMVADYIAQMRKVSHEWLVGYQTEPPEK